MGGKQDQFLSGYDEYADALYRFCYFRIPNKELAADLVQDTFMKTWAYMAEGGIVDNMKAFLYRTARNLIIDQYRAHRTDSLDALMDGGFDLGADDRQRIIDRLDGEQALTLLSKIPKEYSEAVYMRFVEGLSNQEIAEATGELPNTIAVRVKRGLSALRELMSNPQ